MLAVLQAEQWKCDTYTGGQRREGMRGGCPGREHGEKSRLATHVLALKQCTSLLPFHSFSRPPACLLISQCNRTPTPARPHLDPCRQRHVCEEGGYAQREAQEGDAPLPLTCVLPVRLEVAARRGRAVPRAVAAPPGGWGGMHVRAGQDAQLVLVLRWVGRRASGG